MISNFFNVLPNSTENVRIVNKISQCHLLNVVSILFITIQSIPNLPLALYMLYISFIMYHPRNKKTIKRPIQMSLLK